VRGRKNYRSDIVCKELFAHHHLTDEALLLWLDGELSSKQVVEVDLHVQACWSCRSRRQAMEEGIADLVDYHSAVTAPYLPPPSDGREVFLVRLEKLAGGTQPQASPIAWRSVMAGLRRFIQVHQLACIACALVSLAVGFMILSWRSSPTASPDHLLQLAKESEDRSLKMAVDPVIVQQVRISMGKASLTRTLYRDVKHHRVAGRTDASAPAESKVKAAYSNSSLNWNSMLDTESYRHWRDGRHVISDRVVRIGSDRLRLETTLSEGSVRQTALTVRTVDYHPVAETFLLEDHSRIEIAELSYAVVPFASLPQGTFESLIEQPSLPLPTLPRPHAVLPSSIDLIRSEIDAEFALHTLGADLGEQIKVTARSQRDVLIAGVVKDSERKQQLSAALHGIPHTRLNLLTVQEAAEESSLAQDQPSQPEPSGPEVIVAAPPLLEAELASRFPDKDQRIAYVNQTLSLAQMASARAWALNRLADRYPSAAVAALGDDPRRKLQVLLADHVTALREDLSSAEPARRDSLPVFQYPLCQYLPYRTDLERISWRTGNIGGLEKPCSPGSLFDRGGSRSGRDPADELSTRQQC